MGDEEHHEVDPQPQQDHGAAAGHCKPGEHGDPQLVQQLTPGGARLTVRNAKTQDTQLGEFMRTFAPNREEGGGGSLSKSSLLQQHHHLPAAAVPVTHVCITLEI